MYNEYVFDQIRNWTAEMRTVDVERLMDVRLCLACLCQYQLFVVSLFVVSCFVVGFLPVLKII